MAVSHSSFASGISHWRARTPGFDWCPVRQIAWGGREARGGTQTATPAPPLVLLALRPVGVATSKLTPRRGSSGLLAVRVYSAANAKIYRGFARIRAQTGGGTVHECAPPPDFIGNLQARRPSQPDQVPKTSGFTSGCRSTIGGWWMARHRFATGNLSRTRGGAPSVSGVPPRASLPPPAPCSA